MLMQPSRLPLRAEHPSDNAGTPEQILVLELYEQPSTFTQPTELLFMAPQPVPVVGPEHS
jgi:hypothetical protein